MRSMIVEIINDVAYILDRVEGNKFGCNMCALNTCYDCALARSCNNSKGKLYYRLLTADERQQVIAALGRGIK